jgi:hypothetical protein
VEQRLTTAQQGNPAKGLADIDPNGEDKDLRLTFHINRQRLADAQAFSTSTTASR